MGDPKSQLRSGRFANVKRNDRATGHRVAQNVIGVGFHFRVLGLALAAMVVGMVLLSGTVVTRAMHLGFCFCMNHSGMQLRVRITGHPKQDAGQDKCRRHKHADDVSRQLHEVYLTQFLECAKETSRHCFADSRLLADRPWIQNDGRVGFHFLIRKS